jgi:hypothetical protein
MIKNPELMSAQVYIKYKPDGISVPFKRTVMTSYFILLRGDYKVFVMR